MSSPANIHASYRLLALGPCQGWHANQLACAASELGHTIDFASYESLEASVGIGGEVNLGTSPCGETVVVSISRAGDSSGVGSRANLMDYDAILVRTMPAASLERITFRLACLHAVHDGVVDDRPLAKRVPVINAPRGLEWAIDKYATLTRLSAAGYATPPTAFCQSRDQAMDAFERFGADCVVKPMLGGEGRGVMRISDPQLAWTTFSTLDRLDSVLQVQKFIAPGGKDRRYLVIGDRVFGVRRDNPSSFRSNVSAGGKSRLLAVDPEARENAIQITRMLGLTIASVDQIDNENGSPMYLEVNAIPGWKGAQQVVSESIASEMIQAVVQAVGQAVSQAVPIQSTGNLDSQPGRDSKTDRSTPLTDRAAQQ